MSALSVLAEILSRVVRLEVVGDRLRYEAPSGVVDAALRESVGRERDEILKLLESPRKALSQEWEKTLEEISGKWNTLNAQNGAAPWLSRGGRRLDPGSHR